jgi:hypothetical protein
VAAEGSDGAVGQGRAEEEARRKSRQAKAAAARRGPSGKEKEKAHFVFKYRHLVVKRRENITEDERDDLVRMREYLPEPALLRRFADRIYRLFDTPKDLHQASCRRATVLRDQKFRAVPELVKAVEQIDDARFPRLMAYLKNPAAHRVRTNNHVGRTNRTYRFIETVRFEWRRRRTLVRFVVLRLDEVRSEGAAAVDEKRVSRQGSAPHCSQRTRQAT